MNEAALRELATAILVFARVGACLLAMPGFAGTRIPVRVRLAAALAGTLALQPLAGAALASTDGFAAPALFARLILSETLVGLGIGLMARLFFLAFEALLTAGALSIGVASIFPTTEEADAPTPLVTLVSLAALVAVVLADLHVMTLAALADSYAALAPATLFEPGPTLAAMSRLVARAFLVALQAGAPLIVYGLVANLAFALIGKAAPQMAVYFVAAPFVAAGGLLLLFAVVKGQVGVFAAQFLAWFAHG